IEFTDTKTQLHSPMQARVQYLRKISRSVSSTVCAEIPSSLNPGILDDETLSTCISSTWFRGIDGLGIVSAIQAKACQAANGTGMRIGFNPASRAIVLRSSSYV